MTTNPRIEALVNFLGSKNVTSNDITESRHRDNLFEVGNEEFLVLTDEEADEAVSEAIKNALWAFNAEFIASHTKNGLSEECIEALKETQCKLCESANPIVESMIDDLDHFIDDAVMSDGRGHFISHYDGKENEIIVDGEAKFFIFQLN